MDVEVHELPARAGDSDVAFGGDGVGDVDLGGGEAAEGVLGGDWGAEVPENFDGWVGGLVSAMLFSFQDEIWVGSAVCVGQG